MYLEYKKVQVTLQLRTLTNIGLKVSAADFIVPVEI
jgi:hypothetical protein